MSICFIPGANNTSKLSEGRLPPNSTELFPPIHPKNEPMRLQREELTDISIKKLTPAAQRVCVHTPVCVADRYTGLPCVSDHPAQREEANPTHTHTRRALNISH